MPEAYSGDLRKRVLADCDSGMNAKEAAAKYSVSAWWVRKIKRIRTTTGHVGPIPQNHCRTSALDPYLPRLDELVDEKPDRTLDELVAKLGEEGVKTNRSAVDRALRKLKLVVKKKVFRASEQMRPDVQEKRALWLAQQASLDVETLVFVDETAARTDMARRYGRARVGERLVDYVPQNHWKTITYVSALRWDGMMAEMTFEGAMNGDRFEHYVKNVLGPLLRPGDIVVMDNLKCHKRPSVREAILAVGARPLYLPPYSPDFNPIELAYSKLKRLLRSLAHRTVDGLLKALAQMPAQYGPEECLAYMAHSGYGAAS